MLYEFIDEFIIPDGLIADPCPGCGDTPRFLRGNWEVPQRKSPFIASLPSLHSVTLLPCECRLLPDSQSLLYQVVVEDDLPNDKVGFITWSIIVQRLDRTESFG